MNLRDIAALIKVVKLFVVLNCYLKEHKHIPTWLVSYNDRSYPDINTMIEMIEPYRNVRG